MRILRLLEIIFSIFGVAIIVLSWTLGFWVADSWLKLDTLDPTDVARCVGVVGIALGLRLVSGIYIDIAIIDTHISLTRDEIVNYKGHEYWGGRYTEYSRQPTPEQTEKSTWASIGNLRSFWPTKPSLVNAIVDAGFNSVYECLYPAWNDIPSDRVALVAQKGKRERILAADFDEGILDERVDEVPKVGPVRRKGKGLSAIKLQSRRIARLFGLR